MIECQLKYQGVTLLTMQKKNKESVEKCLDKQLTVGMDFSGKKRQISKVFRVKQIGYDNQTPAACEKFPEMCKEPKIAQLYLEVVV